MRRTVREKAVRFALKLTCCKCGCKEKYIMGYDYPSLNEAKKHIPQKGWNGWYIGDNIELCAICTSIGMKFTELIGNIAKEGKQACKKGKQIDDCPYHKNAELHRSSWLRGFLIEKYKNKKRR